ncbi:MAG: rhombotarget lipoprotein [Methylomonas sp.]|jgi:rhombotail lipoprotein
MFNTNYNGGVFNLLLKFFRAPVFNFLAAFSFTSLSGCANTELIHSSASAPLAEVINNVTDSRQINTQKPLTLPASVGVIFVPGAGLQHIPNTTLHEAAEKLKEQLLANTQYIKSVAVVSGDDLITKISLDRIQAQYSVDLIILISYRQDERIGQSGDTELDDFGFIGAFFDPGVETKTSTIIDGKVIDAANNAMIFKAGGYDEQSSASSSYSRRDTPTEESIQGLLAATADFGKTLSRMLAKFENYDVSQEVPMSAVIEASASSPDKTKMTNDY